MLLLIDNYDSFTYNLFHYLGELGAETRVVRNDEIDVQAATQVDPRGPGAHRVPGAAGPDLLARPGRARQGGPGVQRPRALRRGAAPIVIGRDHLDTGSVASPYRETESMLDGSDAIADWPLLNALVNTASGASWVSIHHGGGVGIGRSLHAGQVSLADGTDLAAQSSRGC